MSSLINLPQNFIFSPSSSPSLKPNNNNVIQLTLPQSFPSLTLSCSATPRRRRKPRKSQSWEEELQEDPDLESEVFEYMKSSDNPNLFPTKEDLILGGRFDLVKRIVKHGGWLSYGWDLDDLDEQEEQEEQDSRLFQERMVEANAGNFEEAAEQSSSGRIVEEDCSGIDGILTRLEKERNWGYGGCRSKDVRGNGNSRLVKRRFSGPNSSLDVWSDCSEPDTWRNWSNKRAGCSESDFEAAEFEDQFIQNDQTAGTGKNETGTLRTQMSLVDKIKEYKQIKSHLQNLELELASVLSLLGPKKCDTVVSDKTLENSPEESHSLDDAWEFRETEIMKARDKLRSLRAQVAVAEGKMALRVIEAQKMVELKQKKVRYAERALSLLRTASVTWHNSAKEVLLVGSFDGWTSQRRMQKSSPGIFTLHLKLYPGRYEIKFIVDGDWMIDPLRPVVNNNGQLNNLLIVS